MLSVVCAVSSQMLSMHSFIMVVLLLIQIMHRNIPQMRLHEQRQPNRKALN
jgi:hypothetical protein